MLMLVATEHVPKWPLLTPHLGWPSPREAHLFPTPPLTRGGGCCPHPLPPPPSVGEAAAPTPCPLPQAWGRGDAEPAGRRRSVPPQRRMESAGRDRGPARRRRVEVLVAGGTGFIGSHVVDELAKGGRHTIAVMTRDPAAATRREGVARYVQGDVADASSLARASEQIEAVVHCVQFPNHPVENPRRGWTYERVDGDGTERMVAACMKSGVRRFVYLSGAGVAPGRDKPWWRAKARAERAIVESGMEYVIIRPSWVYGPEDRSLNKFIAFVKYLPIVPIIVA